MCVKRVKRVNAFCSQIMDILCTLTMITKERRLDKTGGALKVLNVLSTTEAKGVCMYACTYC